MRARAISRRKLLRGAGGIALALPLFEAMLPKPASAADADHKRLVLMFTSNGTDPARWLPSADFTFGPILAPLERHKSDLLVVSGLDMLSSGGDRKGHNRGVASLWTGTAPPNGNDGATGYAASVSLDQHIASQLAGETRFASLELGVQVKFTIPRGRMIYNAAGEPIAPEENPFHAFDRLFGDFGADDAELARIRARRGTVLDAVQDDIALLQKQLGAADKQRLASHLDAVRAIEERLDKLTTIPSGCEPPTMGAGFDHKKPQHFVAVGELMMDLLVMALACDMTRVASLMWSSALSNHVHEQLGISEGHHELSHALSNAQARDKIAQINTWFAERLAGFIDRMKLIEEPAGTLLDNTVICWGSELGKGQPHNCRDIPFVLAGSCGGALATGRHIAYDGRSHNDLLITLMQAMGVPGTTFGDPAHSGGALSELLD